MDALRNQIIERKVIEMVAAEAKIEEFQDDSFLRKQPDEAVLQHMIAPSAPSFQKRSTMKNQKMGRNPALR